MFGLQPSRVLVTGATGFVGRAVCRLLVARNCRVLAAVRSVKSAGRLPKEVEIAPIGDLCDQVDWRRALREVDVVVHLAARVHVLKEQARDPLSAFRRVNVDASARLAEAAAGHVRRFIYISSAHAMCRTTDALLDESTPCRPDGPYGQSKWEAEQALSAVAQRSGLPLVILRPPPVYGPEGQGNLIKLFQLVRRGWPLPLGRLNNRRSFLYVENLADAIATCADHPAAAGRTFLLSDGEDISTAELVRRLGKALRYPAHLWNVPLGPLRLAGRVLRQESIVERLLGSLAVDNGQIRRDLNWVPPHTLNAGLAATAAWIQQSSANVLLKAA
jgi:nucleoside-diphosphate-sugar epimerase